jgi:hypothetical protein
MKSSASLAEEVHLRLVVQAAQFTCTLLEMKRNKTEKNKTKRNQNYYR